MFMNLKRSTRRLLMLLAVLPTTVLILGTIYMVGMTYLEGTPRTFLASLQWATETATTTGYGGDNHWENPAMGLFVIVGQFMGQFLVFLIFPIFVLPYFERAVRSPLAAHPAADGRQGAVLSLWPGHRVVA